MMFLNSEYRAYTAFLFVLLLQACDSEGNLVDGQSGSEFVEPDTTVIDDIPILRDDFVTSLYHTDADAEPTLLEAVNLKKVDTIDVAGSVFQAY